MKDDKYRLYGFIGSMTFHIILFIILLFCGFTRMPKPKEGEGIIIAFAKNKAELKQIQARFKPKPTPKVVPKPKKTVKPKVEKNNGKKILTQNFEKAPVIKSTKKKTVKKKKKKDPLLEKRRKERIEKERKLREEKIRKQKIEREKRLKEKREKIRKERELQEKRRKEQERIAKEKAEKERLEKERIAKENARKAKIANINKKTKGLFGKKNSNGNSDDSNKIGKGKNIKGNYTGTGLSKKGISYSLSGRSATYIARPSSNFQKTGTVVVTIYVDKKGNVTRANAGARGTTTQDIQLHKLAVKAAKNTKFNSNLRAPGVQKGTITYVFIMK